MGLLKVETAATDQAKIMVADAAFTSVVRDALLEGLRRGASDIHFEATQKEYRIRFRVYGRLTTFNTFDLVHKDAINYEVKRQFNLPVTDTQSTASGSAYYPDWNLKVRSSKVSYAFGEGIVVRLIRLDKKIAFSDIGYIHKLESVFREAVQASSGVIVIGGPTGSGKSTTLQSLVGEINREDISIRTLEDPVEAIIPGATQMSVTKHQSFADGLREMLRQDPDVILVGEIRDRETAKLCFEAANTGHLVLTTIHANSPWGIFQRLIGLGLEKEVISESIVMLASQGLFPRLCQHCAIPSEDRGASYKHKGPGCEMCIDGIYREVPVPEVLLPSEKHRLDEKDACTIYDSRVSLNSLATAGVIDASEAANV